MEYTERKLSAREARREMTGDVGNQEEVAVLTSAHSVE